MPALIAPEHLIELVLALIVLELLALAGVAALGRGGALLRRMGPTAAAGLFLALSLQALQGGSAWLPLWLACAGAAHGLDWWLRTRV
jgi:hypothetical protein